MSNHYQIETFPQTNFVSSCFIDVIHFLAYNSFEWGLWLSSLDMFALCFVVLF